MVYGLTVTTVDLTVLKDAQQNRQSTHPRVSLQMLPETTVCRTASKVEDPSWRWEVAPTNRLSQDRVN